MNGTDAAALFRAMADRLARIDPGEFGGAFLIVPPSPVGQQQPVEPIDGLSVSSAPATVTFLSGLQGQVELTIANFQASTQQGGKGRGGW